MMCTVSGDFSRFTFGRLRRYIQVLLQQGRVQLDSDANEQQDIDGRETPVQDREERVPDE